MDRKEVGIILIILLLIYVLVCFNKYPKDNTKLENLIIINNSKVDSLNTKIKDYEYKRNEVQERIDSVNIIIGVLPKF